MPYHKTQSVDTTPPLAPRYRTFCSGALAMLALSPYAWINFWLSSNVSNLIVAGTYWGLHEIAGVKINWLG
jgi:hypothetical protein